MQRIDREMDRYAGSLRKEGSEHKWRILVAGRLASRIE